MTLEQARHTLLRQSSEARLMDPVVFSAARELRLRQEEQLLAERKRCTGARAALRVHSAGAAAILPIAGSCAMVKKERMRLRLRRQEKSNGTVDFDTASKGFDAADLGQGRKHAGGVVYRKNRLDLLMRVSRHFPALTGKIQGDWMRNFRLWDAQKQSSVQCGMGPRVPGRNARIAASTQDGTKRSPAALRGEAGARGAISRNSRVIEDRTGGNKWHIHHVDHRVSLHIVRHMLVATATHMHE